MPDPVPVVERIVADVMTALAAIDGVTVHRNRDEAVTAFPAIVVFDGDVDTDPNVETGADTHALNIEVEFWVAAKDGAALGAARHTLYAQIVTALAADYTRGGVARDTQETGSTFQLFTRAAGGDVLTRSAVSFRILFATKTGDSYTAM